MRELENYQHVIPEANVSHFPFIFFNLSGFSTLLVTTCLLRLFTQDFYHGTTYLTNRFHFAVRLFSNRSQMTSKCGKNKKVAHEAIAECVTDVLTTF